MPALSIRQPHAEQILRGNKTIKYRNMATNKRERVYVYASKTPADQESWDEIGLEPGDLPTGVIVGTVEVVGCRKVRGEYEWDVAKPVRLRRPINPRTIRNLRGSIRSDRIGDNSRGLNAKYRSRSPAQ
jgi:hypothetical protein